MDGIKEQAVPVNHTWSMTGKFFSQNIDFIALNIVHEKYSGRLALPFLSVGLEIRIRISGFLEIKNQAKPYEDSAWY